MSPDEFCTDCGGYHDPERRRAIVRRMGPFSTPKAVREAWGDHLWPRTPAGDRALNRDLAAVYPHRPRRVLTEAQRVELRQMVARGCTAAHAARRLGVSPTTAAVVLGRRAA